MGKVFKTFLVVLPVLCIVACFYGRRGSFRASVSKADQNVHAPESYSMQNALKEENVVPVAIIGSGPAGLSAALYVARAGMKAFVFAGPMPCGQLTQTTYIENWPGTEKIMGPELMNDMKKQVVSFGATIIHDTVTSIDFTKWPFSLKTEEGRCFKAMSIILATGATPKTLGIPGEQEFFGKGVTTCAVCDASFFKGKEVVISGGGDSAAEMVFELAPYVKKVTMLVRKGSMKAAAAIQKRVFECPNAVIEFHKELVAIYGSAKDCQKHEENTCGCNSPEVCAIDVYDNETKKTERRPIDGVFLSIGHDPNNKLIKGSIDLDEHGCMVMNGRTQQSSMPGVFAAGEIQDPFYRQAIVAAGEGAKAALDATSFLYDIGFTVAIGQKLDQNFSARFSDLKVELERIDQYEEELISMKS
ncbi:MAG: FAD-dependent oxidoreductase [Candidatus Dependentiae bacterium]|nr:FAD-dependent oxidoreductase [Candidatus Dependentiae bacterium]